MICPYCKVEIPEGTAYCMNCGAKLVTAQSVVTAPTPAPVSRPAQPLVGMILGLVSAVLALVSYVSTFITVYATYSARQSTAAFSIILGVLTIGLATAAIILSAIGMRRSIRTGGRKYVAGIVFSAVGLAASVFALLYLLIALFVGGMVLNFLIKI